MLNRNRNKGVFLVLVFGIQSICFGQNLVVNPSFENFIHCPERLGNLEHDVADWEMPTLGSTDYFNGCSTAMGTPENFNGQQPADFGAGYVGLYMYAPNDYREYIQGSFVSTLKKGTRYTISFFVSLAERSDFAVNQFGIRFSEFPVRIETSKVLSTMHFSKLQGDTSNQLEISYSKFYSDEKEWILLTQEFIAQGTENYLIIGNFKNNKRTQRFQTKKEITKGSYYYLDMVAVREANTVKYNVNTNVKDELKTDSELVFEDVFFGFNKAILEDGYQHELTSILAYLMLHTEVTIKINGHTDSIGSTTFNQILSEQRAKAISDYFVSKGVQVHRIEYYGFGSSKPIASNKTVAGRVRNRRVECVLIE